MRQLIKHEKVRINYGTKCCNTTCPQIPGDHCTHLTCLLQSDVHGFVVAQYRSLGSGFCSLVRIEANRLDRSLD